MATFNLNGYNSYSGCDIVVTARLNTIDIDNTIREKVYTLGSLQTLSISTHQDKKSVRVIGSMNALDYTMGPRTIAGSLVFAVFDQHFATEMFKDLEESTKKTFFLPDELPALDLTITFANEYGRVSRMAIYGVRIINEGQVMSVNDLYTENTYQFVANALEPLTKGTGKGLNSGKDDEVQLSSVFNYDDLNQVSLGEDIYNYSLNLNNDSLKRVLMNVSVEQPTFDSQEGIATITLSPIQSSGLIVIYNQLQDKTEKEIQILDANTYSYDVFLKQGLYSAWFEENGQISSNTVVFSVDNIGSYSTNYDDSPIVENITNSSIKIVSNNPSHTVGVCINSATNESIEIDLSSKKCTFDELDNNTTYTIYTKQNNFYSKTIQCRTLPEEETLVDSFKKYVIYNSSLLSDHVDQYEDVLNSLSQDEEIIYTISKMNTAKSNELMYMAVKYRNEFNRIINEDKIEYMPYKNLDNIFGNTVIFNSNSAKSNLFYIKNTKEYFVGSEQYPTEITYSQGKSNTLYGVTSITNNNVKSPKYLFFNFDENDKSSIEKLYGKSNQLANINLEDYSAKYAKKTEVELKCLAAMDNKNIDLKLLKAPCGQISEDSIVFDVNYQDSLGAAGNNYYICISDIDECLDNTSFRKIKFSDKDRILIANKYETAINKNEVYALWIEDENYNVISEIGFISNSEDIENFNAWLVSEKISSIVAKLQNVKQKNNILEITHTITDASLKDVYYKIANTFINNNVNNLFNCLFELFKIKFTDYYINQDKYKKVFYNDKTRQLTFDCNVDTQLIYIKFKKNYDYEIEVREDNMIILNNAYDIHLAYLISKNPTIKSGFVLLDQFGNIMSHSIVIEEVE